MFSKSKPKAPEANTVPVPPLPDLRAPSSAPQSSAPAARPAASKAASVLAADLVFEGNVSGAGDLHIDGTVRGDVKVGRLTVGETGNVEGGVQADYVEVRGRIVGAVNGKQVKLMSTAYVDGDIAHEQLSIDVGAYFQGRCLQGRKAEPAPTPSYSAPTGFAPAPATFAAPEPPADTGQLIELKPSA